MRDSERRERAKSPDRVERRSVVWRDVVVCSFLSKIGDKAVMVGDNLKSRLVPRTAVLG